MNRYSLTEGNIFNKLFQVALPIMGTSLIQMAYNMTDMIWLGHLGSAAVAASGTAGMYNWLAQSLMIFCRSGSEIGVSQNFGRGERARAYRIANTALLFSILFGIIITFFYIAMAKPLIGFFQIQDVAVVDNAIHYLTIMSCGMIFQFITITITGMFNGSGNSKAPFIINTIGLVLNMILDPILIYLFHFGIKGAAYATVISEAIVCFAIILYLKTSSNNLNDFKFRFVWSPADIRTIFRWGLPLALESALFTIISMILSRFVSYYGSTAIAVQKVGSQIESISWMAAQGFGAAMSAFVGQNFGAELYDRIKKGYQNGMFVMFLWGIAASLLLLFFANGIFQLFIPEADAAAEGIAYLKILSASQLFMCLELTAAGAFRGIGKTGFPSAISIGFNVLRIPLALLLAHTLLLGLNGIWWALTITSVIKGIITPIAFPIIANKSLHKNQV
ncbi:MAG: MATE family efflux transporter [Anaerofustis sp.]